MLPKRANLSVSTYAMMDVPLDEAVLKLMEEGWKAIEIMCEGRHGELLNWPLERVSGLKEWGRLHGISWSLHAPIADINPAAAGEEERRLSETRFLHTLEIAEMLGCAYVVLHPGEREESSILQPSAVLERRVELFLRSVLSATEESSVVIALENVPPYPNLLGVDSAFLLRVVDSVASPRVGMVFDAGHAHLLGQGECISSLGEMLPHVIAVHFSDNLQVRDDHMRLGAGSVPLKEVMELLHQSGFSGTWVLELRCLADVASSMKWLEQLTEAGNMLI